MLKKPDSLFSCLNCISVALWNLHFSTDSSLGISEMIVGSWFEFSVSHLDEFA